MHPELDRFLEYSRSALPNAAISVITNGILVTKMSEKLINTIKTCRVTIEISVYPPVRNRLNQITEFLAFHGMAYKIFRYGDEFGAFLNAKGDSEKMWSMMQCYAQVCHAMKNGKLYRCSMVMNVEYSIVSITKTFRRAG